MHNCERIRVDPAADGWEAVATGPYWANTGPLWRKRADGHDDHHIYGLLVPDKHATIRTAVFGGILMAFASYVMRATSGDHPTLRLDLSFLNGVEIGEFVTGSGEILRRSASIVFGRGLLQANGRPVASMSSISKIAKREEAAKTCPMTFDPMDDGWRLTRPYPADFGAQLWLREEESGPAFGMIVGEQHLDSSGAVDGGAILALVDQTIGIPGNRLVKTPMVTIQLETRFCGPARAGDFLESRSRVVHSDGQVVAVAGDITAGGRLIATATGIWKTVRPRS